jgi:hypothetical protein
MQTLIAAATLYLCAGSGYIEENMPKVLEPTGQEWIDKVSKSTVDISGNALLKISENLDITLPKDMKISNEPVSLKASVNDHVMIEASGLDGKVRIELNRLSRFMIIMTENGRWIGNCSKQ